MHVLPRQLFRSVMFSQILLVCFATAAYLHLKDKAFGKYHCRSPYAKRYLKWLCKAIGFKIEVVGKPQEGNFLIVSNHISWADIPVLGSVMPVYFLSKAEVRQWPVIGRLAQEAGTLFIKRGDGKSAKVKETIEENLSEGRNVLIFPEGTTSAGETVLKFHPKLVKSAVKYRTPIQPVTIKYLNKDGKRCDIAPYINDDSFPSHIWQIFAQQKIQVEVHLHPPLTVESLEEVPEVTAEMRNNIEEYLQKSAETDCLAATA